MAADSSSRVKSVETSIRLIEALQKLNGATLDELAAELDQPKSTVYDHVKTLESNDFIVKEDRQYRAGLRFLELGGYVRNRRNIYEYGKQEAEQLAEDTGELVNLVVEEHGRILYLYLAHGDNAINLDTYVGKRERMHHTAVGKAILASLPDERIDGIIDRQYLSHGTEQSISTRAELDEELERVRDTWFALDLEEHLRGLKCVAAPIKSGENKVHGAISISGPASRLDDDQLTGPLAERVLQAANVIDINVTYS
jgi:DNA-binding IclR family transcriptional regulator